MLKDFDITQIDKDTKDCSVDMFFQSFEISDNEKKLMALASEYHTLCDAYDDRICSGKNKYGESTPRTATEFQLINSNAHQVRKYIINKGAMMGFDRHTVSQAISKYQ